MKKGRISMRKDHTLMKKAHLSMKRIHLSMRKNQLSMKKIMGLIHFMGMSMNKTTTMMIDLTLKKKL